MKDIEGHKVEVDQYLVYKRRQLTLKAGDVQARRMLKRREQAVHETALKEVTERMDEVSSEVLRLKNLHNVFEEVGRDARRLCWHDPSREERKCPRRRRGDVFLQVSSFFFLTDFSNWLAIRTGRARRDWGTVENLSFLSESR